MPNVLETSQTRPERTGNQLGCIFLTMLSSRKYSMWIPRLLAKVTKVKLFVLRLVTFFLLIFMDNAYKMVSLSDQIASETLSTFVLKMKTKKLQLAKKRSSKQSVAVLSVRLWTKRFHFGNLWYTPTVFP